MGNRLTDEELNASDWPNHGPKDHEYWEVSVRMLRAMLTELRDRRKHDREFARLANVCRGYYNRHGNTPTGATMDLLDEVDKLLEGAER